VALARSLATEPRIVLLDEPLTGLDAGLKSAILDDLREWNRSKSNPILYVTHSREEVDVFGERVIAMDQGKIVSEGTAHVVLGAPRRKRLAVAAGFENILAGTVAELREIDGVMRVRIQRVELEVPLADAQVGGAVRIAIRAGDILIATERPHGLSARNLLKGEIVSLEERGPLIALWIDCGDMLEVHITRGAMRTLALSIGVQVYAVIKTHSCHLVDD
jgi:molybdate transport system ATP-binding protein